MIVVAEGAGAAGKTTWCQTHYRDVMVPEVAVEPVGAAGSRERHVFWTDLNSDRWVQALALEEHGGLAVCDGYPFKLHYTRPRHRRCSAPLPANAAPSGRTVAPRRATETAALWRAELSAGRLPQNTENVP